MLAALATGCFPLSEPAYGRCNSGVALSQPSDLGVYAQRQPESPAPIAAEARGITVHPRLFDEDAWGASMLPYLVPRALPVLEGDLAAGGSVLVCELAVGPTPGIDGIDGPNGPVVSLSTPDLLVWADFAGTKVNKGPRLGSSRGTFAYRVSLTDGAPVTFSFGDFDFLSQNDAVGRIEGRYPGKVPFSIRGKAGAATCHAVSPERIAGEAARRREELEGLIAQIERHEPTLDMPLDHALAGRIEVALGAVEYFTGTAGTGVSLGTAVSAESAAVVRRVRAATEKQWARHVEKLRSKHASLPAPGTWAIVSDLAEARVAGLHCQVGEKIIPLCNVAVEVRLRKDPGRCEEGKRFWDEVGNIEVVDARGESTSVLVSGVRVGGRWLSNDTELWRSKEGDVLYLPTFAGGFFYRKTYVGWDMPIVRVGGKELRVY